MKNEILKALINASEILTDARPPMSIKRDWLWTDPEEDVEEDELEMEGMRIIR